MPGEWERRCGSIPKRVSHSSCAPSRFGGACDSGFGSLGGTLVLDSLTATEVAGSVTTAYVGDDVAFSATMCP